MSGVLKLFDIVQSMENYVNKAGYLDVEQGHSIYWEDWGNPDATPIIHLHGGPGSGFHDGHKLLYNPALHHVIFHDQRGSGRSTPFGETDNNTTQALVGDIDKLRDHLDIDTPAYISGGSWSSTLALVYAITYPEDVKKLMIWSIYLASQAEDDYVNEGHQRFSFPEAWERFIGLVPLDRRNSGRNIMNYFSDIIRSPDPEVAMLYSDEWTLWESSLVSTNYDRQELEQEVLGDPKNLAIAKLETHYFQNQCFIPEWMLKWTSIFRSWNPCLLTVWMIVLVRRMSNSLSLCRITPKHSSQSSRPTQCH